MSVGIQLRNGKKIRCLEDEERTSEDGRAALRVAEINDLPNEVLQMILKPAAIQMCLSSRIKTAECLGQVYRRLAICRRWKNLLDDPFFHRKIRESVFQIDPQRKFFKSAKPVAITGKAIAQYGDLLAMDFAAGRIFAYKRSLKNHKTSGVVKVFSFQRRPSKQEALSIRRIGTILIDPNSFKYIVQMQFTDFNNQLVMLFLTTHFENIIWFQYQTGAQNPDPEIWHITQPTMADRIHSSPSTGKVYLHFRWPERIDEYGFSDGLHIRSIIIPLNIFKPSVHGYPRVRFHHADDQLHIAIGSWKNVGTAPIDALDEQHMSVRRFRRRPGWLRDWVVDKHNNLLLLTNEGASYGLSLAPANKMERVRLLVTIPTVNLYEYAGMVFDGGRGLVFLSIAGRQQIHCYRVAMTA